MWLMESKVKLLKTDWLLEKHQCQSLYLLDHVIHAQKHNISGLVEVITINPCP